VSPELFSRIFEVVGFAMDVFPEYAAEGPVN